MRRRWTHAGSVDILCDDDIEALFAYIDQLTEDLAVHERHMRDWNDDIADY